MSCTQSSTPATTQRDGHTVVARHAPRSRKGTESYKTVSSKRIAPGGPQAPTGSLASSSNLSTTMRAAPKGCRQQPAAEPISL
eukprot:scaffold123743_cov46-Prasinocladus_malaysianus.AAC.1